MRFHSSVLHEMDLWKLQKGMVSFSTYRPLRQESCGKSNK